MLTYPVIAPLVLSRQYQHMQSAAGSARTYAPRALKPSTA
jgi:hypothetical protein